MACSVYWMKPFAIKSTMNTMNRPYAAMLGAPSRAPYLSLDLGPWHKIQSNRSLRCTFALGHCVIEHVTYLWVLDARRVCPRAWPYNRWEASQCACFSVGSPMTFSGYSTRPRCVVKDLLVI